MTHREKVMDLWCILLFSKYREATARVVLPNAFKNTSSKDIAEAVSVTTLPNKS